MATKTGFRPNPKPSPYNGSSPAGDRVVLDKSSGDDFFFVVVAVVVLVLFLVFMPVMGYVLEKQRKETIKQEAKIKEQDEKINRLLKRLEEK